MAAGELALVFGLYQEIAEAYDAATRNDTEAPLTVSSRTRASARLPAIIFTVAFSITHTQNQHRPFLRLLCLCIRLIILFFASCFLFFFESSSAASSSSSCPPNRRHLVRIKISLHVSTSILSRLDI